MAKYRVIALSVGALSNKIFYSGDIVDGSAWASGVADQLVQKGFLETVSENVKGDIGSEDKKTAVPGTKKLKPGPKLKS